MGFRINTNVVSLASQRALQSSSKALGKALERLASGSRINRAGDDAAGLAISEGLGSQVRGVRVAVRNANDALGFLNTAEGALAELTNITQRLRELAIQSSNGTLGSTDRGYLNSERAQLLEEFDRIAVQTNFNGANLLDGSFTTTDLQVGIRKGETISFNIGDARAVNLGALANRSGMQNALSAVSSALVINGVSIAPGSSLNDTLSSSGNAYSAISISKAVNAKAGQTGVTADIQNSTVQVLRGAVWSMFSGTLAGDTFRINGVQVTGTGISSTNSFIEAINGVASLSGVKARLHTGSTTLIDFFTLDGRNIQLQISGVASGSAGGVLSSSFAFALAGFTGAALSTDYGGQYTLAYVSGGFGFTHAFSTFSFAGTSIVGVSDINATFTGAIRMRSASAITIAGSADASAALGISGITSGLVVAVDKSNSLSTISIGTQSAASDALSVLDATLASLNSLRSSLGATQSRLDSAMSSLGITLENISAARSQIRDADVATETAELTRAQILQQAGVAVLGQANTSAQAALSLLKF